MVEVSFTALKVREVLKWRTAGVVVEVDALGRVSVLKERACATSSAFMRAIN